MSGATTLAAALRAARPVFVGAVPGTPVTAPAEILVAAGEARWLTHEAVALQMAVGAASDGGVAFVLLKQVGLNAAMDVLACSAPHRTGGALVIVVGDDPGAGFSQLEGDARALAMAAEVPCVEPAGVQDVPAAVADAVSLSAENAVPVLLRVTTQLMVEGPDLGGMPTGMEPRPFDATRTWGTDALGQRELLAETLVRIAALPGCRRVAGGGDVSLRILTSGSLAPAAVRSGADTLVVRRPIPVPERELASFVAESSAPLLVLEEGLPILEREVGRHARGRVLGRFSGHVAATGPVDAKAAVEAARSGGLPARPKRTPVRETPEGLAPYGTLFDDLVALHLGPVACDAGLAYAAAYLPSGVATLSLGLGSAIGAAAGIALRRGRAVAVVGDMSVFHAGVLGLLQVVRDQLPVLGVVLDNGTAAQTGGQPHVGARPARGQREVSLERLATGIGLEWTRRVTARQAARGALRPLLEAWATLPCPGLLIVDDRDSRA